MLLRLEWGAPQGGTLTDHFYLAGPETLHVETVMEAGGRSVAYRQVYRRRQ